MGVAAVRCSRTFYILLILIGSLALALFLIPPWICPENYPADDAFFYLQVAHHIVAGDGSTFNTITYTNGYHPLWMCCCIAVQYIAGLDKSVALIIAIVLQQGIALCSVLLFFRLCRVLKLKYGWLAIPIFCIYFSTRLYATEAYVNLLMQLILLFLGAKTIADGSAERGWRWQVLIGFVAGGAILARLDNIFVVASFYVLLYMDQSYYSWSKMFGKEHILSGMRLIIGCLFLVGGYMLYNKYWFGHFTPVSGAIKSTLPELVFNLNALSGIGKICVLFAILSLIVTAIPSVCSHEQRLVLLVLALGVLFHACQLVVTTEHHTQWPWYYVSGVLNMCFVSVVLANLILRFCADRDYLWGRFAFLASMVAVLSLAINSYSAIRYRSSAPTILESFELDRFRNGVDKRWQQRVAMWLKKKLPRNTSIAVYDWPGIIAYYSDLNILPLDGLIADYQYNDDIVKWGIVNYFEHRSIHYWLGPATVAGYEQQSWYTVSEIADGQCLCVKSPYYDVAVGCLDLFSSQSTDVLLDNNRDVPPISLWTF